VLSPTTAFGGGVVISAGSSPIIQRGVCWSTSQNPTIANNFTNDGVGTGSFASSIFPLQPSTTYYIRAFAVNSLGTAYGDQFSITTFSASLTGSLPTVSTSTVIYNDGLTANCGGEVTTDGGLAVLSRGVCWAIGTTPTINNSFTVSGSGAGSYSSTLTNLLPNTNYFVRAFATNDAGTAYGITYSLMTNALPIVITESVSSVTTGSANVSGTVQSSATSPIIARGICWSLNPSPTLSDNIISSGSGNGTFNKNILGLLNSTTCFARAYATSSVGTSYGNVISFTTNTFSASPGSGITFDGYTYETVLYGNGQEWMSENLRTTQYANGDPIPNVQDGAIWYNLSTGAWSNYANDSQFEIPYGKLYNGAAVNDSRNVCPSGWHVPNSIDFTNLVNYLGGQLVANSKMRITGTQFWGTPNTYATNESLFSAMPGGLIQGGTFPSTSFSMGGQANFWVSGSYLVLRLLNNYSFVSSDPLAPMFSVEYINGGCSVRCIKD